MGVVAGILWRIELADIIWQQGIFWLLADLVWFKLTCEPWLKKVCFLKLDSLDGLDRKRDKGTKGQREKGVKIQNIKKSVKACVAS